MRKPLPHFENLVIGLGKTGVSCVRHLSRLGRPLAVADTRLDPPGLAVMQAEFPQVPVYTGALDPALLLGADRIIVSPGVSNTEPAVRAALAQGAQLTGDIDLFRAEARAPVIAVTGTNGKSTVATLVHEMLLRAGRRALLGGNIGTPALDLLEQEPPDCFVLELSSFQLERVQHLNASVAALLNLSPDHMDRYATLEDYIRAKSAVYAGAGAMVVNRDDARVWDMRRSDRPCLSFTLAAPAPDEFGMREESGRAWLAHGARLLLAADEMPIRGAHNAANALAACAVCHAAGVDYESMCAVLRTFPGLVHRCRRVSTRNGVDWFDDSKGTNPGATAAAIKGLARGRNVVLIAGGDGKGADFAPLRDIARQHVRSAVLIGRDARIVAAALAPDTPCRFATDMPAAVQEAAQIAQAGDVVLLSPACASFDMFADYQERGRAFERAVQRLAESGGRT